VPRALIYRGLTLAAAVICHHNFCVMARTLLTVENSRCETREGQRQCVSRPPVSSRRKRGRAHHQPEAVVLDFVNPEFIAACFFSALRFLVAVSSDLSGCSCVLKARFSKLSRRP
jgi:hypothetical protein